MPAHPRYIAVIAVVLALSLAAVSAGSARAEPASSQMITFGAPLTEPPDAAFNCGSLALPDGSTTPLAPGTTSCVWSTPLNPADPIEGLTTPAGNGTITGVRIRLGAGTGPMSFVILQAEKTVATQAVSCCEATVVTQPFLPAANKVNAFRTDLPVHTDAPGESSGGVQVTDMLGIAVLNSATPIPALYETGTGPTDELAAPAPLQGQSATMTKTSGYQLDLQADWVPGTPVPPTPRVRFASGRVFVSHGRLHVPLRCRFTVCKGTIAVRSGGRGRSRRTYAGGPFRIGQSLYRSIAVPLAPAGKAAARDRARVAVGIHVTYTTPSGPKTIMRTVAVRF